MPISYWNTHIIASFQVLCADESGQTRLNMLYTLQKCLFPQRPQCKGGFITMTFFLSMYKLWIFKRILKKLSEMYVIKGDNLWYYKSRKDNLSMLMSLFIKNYLQ